MKNKVIKHNANNLMWVEYWIQNVSPTNKDYELFAEKYDDKKWICEIHLPLINEIAKSISTKEVNAMINASEKAAKLINEYMKSHPELKINIKFICEPWEIESYESGNFVSIGMKRAWIRKQFKEIEKVEKAPFKSIEKTIKNLAEINGTSKNLFVQILSRSLFDKNKSIEEIMCEVDDKIICSYRVDNLSVSYNDNDDCIIAMGYLVSQK